MDFIRHDIQRKCIVIGESGTIKWDGVKQQVSMLKQGERLNEIFEEWRGDSPQVDDVTLIGIRY